MSATIAVSIVMPAFNAAAFLPATLRSVADQTEQRYELLVVDDCSTDATAELVATAARSDPRIRLLRLARNAGPAAARNAGIDAARGQWVALLDADDEYHPTRLEHLLAVAAQTGADMVSDNILLRPIGQAAGLPTDQRGADSVMFSAARIPGLIRLAPDAFVVENTRRDDGDRKSFGFMQPIIRRAFLCRHRLRYRTETRFGEDFLLYVACLVAGARWWVTPAPLYIHNVRFGSLSDSASDTDLRVISALERDLIHAAEQAGDHALAQALRAHRRTIDHWRHTRAFQAALRGRDLPAALAVAFGTRSGLQAVVRDVAANTVLKPFLPWIKRRLARTPRTACRTEAAARPAAGTPPDRRRSDRSSATGGMRSPPV